MLTTHMHCKNKGVRKTPRYADDTHALRKYRCAGDRVMLVLEGWALLLNHKQHKEYDGAQAY
jgi:hypothetical protein